jgi:hypothetical protein
VNNKTIAALSVVALSAAALTGCGGSSSSGGGGQPGDDNNLMVTSMSIQLPSVCASQSLYGDSNLPDSAVFGYYTIRSDGGIQTASSTTMYADSEYTQDQIFNGVGGYGGYNGSLNVQVQNIFYILGDEDNPTNPSGVAHVYCLDSDNNQHELSFSIDDSNGNQLSSNLNLNNVNYTGPIVFVGTEAQSDQKGIYLYDPKHPKAHSQQDTLNNTHKL